MMDAVRLGFDPFLAWPILWGLVAAAVLVWLFYLYRRGRAWLTRALALTLLVLAISNPAIVQEEREPLKSIAALVLDRSESMTFGARAIAAEEAFEALRTQLSGDQTLDLRIVETDTSANGTNLRAALDEAFADAPRDRIAGSILITDGQVHDLPRDPDDLTDFGPVHGLVVGDPNEGDRRIEIVQSPNFGIVGEPVELVVRAYDPTTTTVPLIVSVNGREPFTIPAQVGADTGIRFEMERRGPNTVVIEAEEGPRELTLANNLAAETLSGVPDHLRVLLITGEPHQGARVWRDLLKSDPDVDLVHFTILRPPHKQDGTPTNELSLISFPTRELFEEKLDDFDLIIFDQYRRRGVLQMAYFDNMAKYVENGGALLIVAGEQFAGPASLHRTPLAGVLPVRPTGAVIERRFVPELTETGRRHTVTAPLEGRSWGGWRRFIGAEITTGDVLLQTDDGSPLLILDRVEKGRVAELMSDQLWLWARGYEGGGPFAETVRRIVHWLLGEPELEEEKLALDLEGQIARITLRTLEANPPGPSLLNPEGSTVALEWREVSPGFYEAEAEVDQLGLYRARLDDLEAVALSGPANPIEYTDLRSTTDIIRPVSDATGGAAKRLGESGNLNLPDIRRVGERGRAEGTGWIGLRERDAYAVRSSRSQPLLPGVMAVSILLLLLLLAWRREGR